MKHQIVFICGYSGAGKTSISNKLAELLPVETKIIRLDWYINFPTKERKKRIETAQASKDVKIIEAEENPFNWQDYERIKEDLCFLQEHSKLDISSAWNQKTGLKDLDLQIEFTENQGVIICEGMYLLHPELSKLADLIVYLDIPYETAFERICSRDSHRSSKEYLDYKNFLQNKYDLPYFDKYLDAADLKVNVSTTSPDSIAIQILKNLAK